MSPPCQFYNTGFIYFLLRRSLTNLASIDCRNRKGWKRQKVKNIFLIAPFLFFYCGRRSSRPKGLPKWCRNRRRSSHLYGAIEALLYDPLRPGLFPGLLSGRAGSNHYDLVIPITDRVCSLKFLLLQCNVFIHGENTFNLRIKCYKSNSLHLILNESIARLSQARGIFPFRMHTLLEIILRPSLIWVNWVMG